MDPKAIRLQPSPGRKDTLSSPPAGRSESCKVISDLGITWWAAPDLPSPLSICLLSNCQQSL